MTSFLFLPVWPMNLVSLLCKNILIELVEDIAAELEILQINGVAAVQQGFGDSDSYSSDDYDSDESN